MSTMMLSELILKLSADIADYGDVPVRVDTDQNHEVGGTQIARYSGESTLFVILGPGEAD